MLIFQVFQSMITLYTCTYIHVVETLTDIIYCNDARISFNRPIVLTWGPRRSERRSRYARFVEPTHCRGGERKSREQTSKRNNGTDMIRLPKKPVRRKTNIITWKRWNSLIGRFDAYYIALYRTRVYYNIMFAILCARQQQHTYYIGTSISLRTVPLAVARRVKKSTPARFVSGRARGPSTCDHTASAAERGEEDFYAALHRPAEKNGAESVRGDFLYVLGP